MLAEPGHMWYGGEQVKRANANADNLR